MSLIRSVRHVANFYQIGPSWRSLRNLHESILVLNQDCDNSPPARLPLSDMGRSPQGCGPAAEGRGRRRFPSAPSGAVPAPPGARHSARRCGVAVSARGTLRQGARCSRGGAGAFRFSARALFGAEQSCASDRRGGGQALAVAGDAGAFDPGGAGGERAARAQGAGVCRSVSCASAEDAAGRVFCRSLCAAERAQASANDSAASRVDRVGVAHGLCRCVLLSALVRWFCSPRRAGFWC